jgi:alpha-L-fucosidase
MINHLLSIKNSLWVVLLLIGTNSIKSQGLVEPMDTGRFQPTWESLKQYSSAPDWYRDAKFGIWAHWGPQCQPEQGDWFARFMYYPGSQRNWFTSNYGTASNVGFKEVINSWKAQNWNPDSIVKVYKNAGAMYFFVMGNHHDNVDMWDSKYQEWNTVKVGPKKDILDGWEKAARKNNLKFGVSIHASHAWSWLEPSQAYDGNLTKADGAGKWWDGLDPQELYAQNHAHSSGWDNSGTIHSQWNWVNGVSIPSAAYCNKFYNRTMDMIKRYNPDLVYFDDTSLPLVSVDNSGNRSTTTVSDVGLRIAASYYNKGANSNGGKVNNVIFGKILTADEKECLVWDVERGIPDKPQDKPWQTCTCIGDWHYNRSIYNNNGYKSANTVIHMLVDIVSKNGNLLLNVPLRGDGTYDEKEYAVVQGITAWMNVNKEGIYGTRPWVIFGEGPTAERANALSGQGFNEGTSYDARDIRYVKKGDSIVYVTLMGWPTTGTAVLKSLASNLPYLSRSIKSIKILGGSDLTYSRSNNGLSINLPATKPATADIGITFKISLDTLSLSNLKDLIKVAGQNDSTAKLNAGTNSGQYSNAAIAVLEAAVVEANKITETNTSAEIQVAFTMLQTAIINLITNGRNLGGIIEYQNSQNITAKYLKEARIFSRSDANTLGTSRFGLLGEPWAYTDNIINQSGNTVGGFDNYSSSQSIGVQKWNASDAAITDGMIYQTTTLPAGKYKLKIKVHENYGLAAGEIYLSATLGNTVPQTANVTTSALGYYDMSQTATGQQYTVCPFTVSQTSAVSIGWSISIAAAASQKSMRVNEILLLDSAGNNISATYLKNYTNIQRKDNSYTRFGVPTNWSADFNIPQTDGSGTKQGIDKYPGYNTLMLGVWDDVARSAKDATNARLYKKITLPAGRYFFGANYETLSGMSKVYLFASKSIPNTTNVESTSIAYHKISADKADGAVYGIEFSLTEQTDVYLGWVGDLTTATQQEFRAKEIVLLQVLPSANSYDKAKAYSAPDANDILIKMPEFARVYNTSGAYRLTPVDYKAYLAGTSDQSMELGVIDFDSVKYSKAYVTTGNANTIASGASYDLFLDSETTPAISVPAIKTAGAFIFEKSESTIGQISGVHKVTLKFNNHASSLMSVGFFGLLRPTITWPTPASITFGTALGAEQLNATATGTTSTPVYDPQSGTILSVGTHTLTVSYAADAKYAAASKSVTIEVTQPLAVEKLSEDGVKIFPNPVYNDVVNVSLTSNKKGSVLKIVNIAGSVVFTKLFEGKSMEVDMKAFASGVYLFRISTPDGEIIKKVDKK